MIQKSRTHRFAAASLLALTLTISPWSRAGTLASGAALANGSSSHHRQHELTILSGPTFTPSAKAPLAGLLQLTTDVKSRVSVQVSDGTTTWRRHFYDFSTNHSEILLGFKPNRTNQILVTVHGKYGRVSPAPQPLTFVTAPLPADFPSYTVLKSEPDRMEPGYALFLIGSHTASYITIMDNFGEVVWYCKPPTSGDNDVQQLDNGDLFLEGQTENEFREMNMLGEIVRTWYPPAGYPINPHEAVVTSHGTILYLSDHSQLVTNLPTSDTVRNPPLTTADVDDNPVVEISYTNSALLNVWSPLLLNLIDPTRVTYLTYATGVGQTSPYGVDTEHANAIIDDTNDNSIILSLRAENAVLKFSRSTRQLEWILGPHALWGTNWQPYLLTPVGSPFNWNYGQHAPELTPQGTLLVYNDNNFAASPFDTPVADQDNYSSAIEYAINETNMTVSEVWNSAWQTNQDRLYTPYVGRVQWLPQTQNVFVDYGAVIYVNGVHPSSQAPNAREVRLIEYTHDPVPKVVFDVSFFDSENPGGDYCYRAYQIHHLYPHPARPVADLCIRDVNEKPFLEFSADPTRSYLIQVSSDLKHWRTIGKPVQHGGAGNFDFEDQDANPSSARFYRVVTQ